MEIKQLKLTNDDEIVCEILDWDEEEGDVVIRYPFKIVHGEDLAKGVKYYFLRPFMLYQDDNLQVLNSGHIICELSPSDSLLSYYRDAIKTAEEDAKTRKIVDKTEDNLKDLTMDSATDAIAELFSSMLDTEKIIH